MTIALITQQRLAQLAETLSLLKVRVREAVASEMGKAVGDAVRDLLAAVLTRSPPQPVQPETPQHYDDRWHDDDDEWQHDHQFVVESTTSLPVEHFQPQPWPAAVTLTALVMRWLMTRRVPSIVGVGISLVIGAFTFGTNPVFRSLATACTAAMELANLAPLSDSP
jgi:hypothetical protein